MVAESTLEAMMVEFRYGVGVLRWPKNRDRLRKLEPDEIRQVVGRLRSWKSLNRAWLPPWEEDDIQALIYVWSRLYDTRGYALMRT